MLNFSSHKHAHAQTHTHVQACMHAHTHLHLLLQLHLISIQLVDSLRQLSDLQGNASTGWSCSVYSKRSNREPAPAPWPTMKCKRHSTLVCTLGHRTKWRACSGWASHIYTPLVKRAQDLHKKPALTNFNGREVAVANTTV